MTQKADGDSGSFALIPQKQTLQNLFRGLTANRPISSAGLPFLALLVLSYIWLPTICLWPKWTKSQLQVGSKRLTWVYWDGFRAQKWFSVCEGLWRYYWSTKVIIILLALSTSGDTTGLLYPQLRSHWKLVFPYQASATTDMVLSLYHWKWSLAGHALNKLSPEAIFQRWVWRSCNRTPVGPAWQKWSRNDPGLI